MPRDGAFRALLVLLVITASAAEVPHPENVTVSCQNTAVTVNWDYPDHQPTARFRVSASLEGTTILNIETSEHHYDLTHVVWDRKEYYLEYLTVQVTALQGGNTSNNEHSNSFSFNSLKVVDTSCSLDFPRVEIALSEEAGAATVSFPNPIQHDQELRRTVTEDSGPQISFTVSSVGNGTKYGDYSSSCSAKDVVCKVDVKFPNDAESCVQLKGIMFDSRGIRQVTFRETDQICAPDSDRSDEVTLAIILTAVTISLLIVVVIFICKVKAWTMKPSKLPTTLVLSKEDHSNQALGYRFVQDEYISRMSIVQHAKSLSDTSEDSQSLSLVDRVDDVDHSNYEKAFYRESVLSESSSQTDSDSAHCSVNTASESISSGDEIQLMGDYELRPAPLEDMGGGDFVITYERN